MKKIFRFILKSLVWLVLILIVALIGIYFYLGAIVKQGVNRYVPAITGTTASVEDVDLSLFKGRIEIKNLQIGNPKGYSTNDIFKLGKVQVLFEPKSIFTDKIIIKSVIISGTQVSAELKSLMSLDSNVSDLQKNVNKYLKSSAKKDKKAKDKKTEAKKQEAPKANEKKVVIKDLQINDSSLSVGVSGKTATFPLPNIQKKNIGEGKKKRTMAEIFADILNMISIESVKGVGTAVTDLAKQGWDGAKDLVKGGANAVADTAKSVKDGAKNAVEGIKGILK